jgi:hypothetical protein
MYTIKCLHHKPVSNHFNGGNCEQQVGLATEFRFGKIPRNRLGIAPLFHEGKCSFRGLRKSGFRNSERKKNPAPANGIDSMFLSETCFGREFREFDSIFFHRTEFRPFFSSAEWFRMEFWKFSVPRNGSERNSESLLQFCSMVQNSPSIFLLWGTVHNGIQRVFCSAEQPDSARTNQLFRLLRLPRNDFLSEIANPNSKEDMSKNSA